MKLDFTKSAARAMAALPSKDRAALYSRMNRIAAAPFASHPDVKPMVGMPGFYRVRQGDWRAVYRLDRGIDVMMVERVAKRGEVYRE
jgi:mRNA interferase RelE/StbE